MKLGPVTRPEAIRVIAEYRTARLWRAFGWRWSRRRLRSARANEPIFAVLVEP